MPPPWVASKAPCIHRYLCTHSHLLQRPHEKWEIYFSPSQGNGIELMSKCTILRCAFAWHRASFQCNNGQHWNPKKRKEDQTLLSAKESKCGSTQFNITNWSSQIYQGCILPLVLSKSTNQVNRVLCSAKQNKTTKSSSVVTRKKFAKYQQKWGVNGSHMWQLTWAL